MSRKPKNGDQGYAGGAPAAVVQQVRREEPSEKFLYQQVQEFFTGGGLERAVYQGLYGLTGDPRYKEYEHPYKGIYREVFKKEYGREPTAIELAQWISYAPVPVTEPLGTQIITEKVKLGEATLGHIEAAVSKPTKREEIMSKEELALQWAIIAAVYAAPIIYGKVKGYLPSYRGSRLDKWLYEHSALYKYMTGGLAEAEIGMPKIGEERRRLSEIYVESILGEKGVTGVAVKGYPKVTPDYWKQVYGLDIVGTLAEPKEIFRPIRREELLEEKIPSVLEPWKVREEYKPLPIGWEQFVGRNFGFKKPIVPIVELLREKGLLPFVTQAQVTRMGIFPEIMKGISVPEKLKRGVFPSIAATIFSGIMPKAQGVSVQESILGSVQKQRQLLKQAQKQIQIQRQYPIRRMILKPYYHERREKKKVRKRRVEGAFAKWFFKKHPIPTGSEVMKHILGK